VFLHKIVTPAPPEEPYECTYEFKVELQRLNSLEFTCDFTGSTNVFLENSSNLLKTATVQAFQTSTVALLKMTKQWTLKTKFKFIMKPAPKPVQEVYLKDENSRISSLLTAAKSALGNAAVGLCSLKELEQLLRSGNITYLDLDFPPQDPSIFREISGNVLNTLVHWRRPHEFFTVNPAEGFKEPSIFAEEIEPADIIQGQLGDCWFMCALSAIAERPALVERLFITKTVNALGIYRVKLFKNGEWQTVTVDDYFPCFPMGGPIFSRSHGNELWVMVLEKAYAKLHGSYYSLKGGFACEGMMDLTGCPTSYFDFEDEQVRAMIASGQLWQMMKTFDEEGFVMSVSSPGEDQSVENPRTALPHGILPGHAYTLLACKEFKRTNLVNLRNPWGKLEWEGDWSDSSPLWTEEMRQQVDPVFDENDGNFWMSFEDIIDQFSNLNVCKVKNWDEVRIKGKFVRVQDLQDASIELVMSKWYYSIDVTTPTRVFIGIHQEDERVIGVALRRRYLDIGIVVLRRLQDGSISIVYAQELEIDREVELEITLDPGSYIILPRTTGCLLRRPADALPERVQLLDAAGNLSELMNLTVADIFRKFDMLLNRELNYAEFKGFYDCISKAISETEFRLQILKKYASTDRGLSLRGFKDFFRDTIKTLEEEVVWSWLDALGYDRELYSVRSRCFILTLHSERELAVTVRDEVQTDLDNRVNVLLIERHGLELDNKKGVRSLYHFSPKTHSYSYGVVNELSSTMEVLIDCSASDSMSFSSTSPFVKKRVEPGQLEFMMHAQALPHADTFSRSAIVTWQAV
jgi:calpain-15